MQIALRGLDRSRIAGGRGRRQLAGARRRGRDRQLDDRLEDARPQRRPLRDPGDGGAKQTSARCGCPPAPRATRAAAQRQLDVARPRSSRPAAESATRSASGCLAGKGCTRPSLQAAPVALAADRISARAPPRRDLRAQRLARRLGDGGAEPRQPGIARPHASATCRKPRTRTAASAPPGEPSQISSAWTALALAAAGVNPQDQAGPAASTPSPTWPRTTSRGSRKASARRSPARPPSSAN